MIRQTLILLLTPVEDRAHSWCVVAGLIVLGVGGAVIAMEMLL